MTAEQHETERLRTLAVTLVHMENLARTASAAGYLQEAADLWAQRDVIRERRSYLMRVLLARRGVTRR